MVNARPPFRCPQRPVRLSLLGACVAPPDVDRGPKGVAVIFLRFSGRVSEREYWRFARLPFLLLPFVGMAIYGVVTVGVLRWSSLVLMI